MKKILLIGCGAEIGSMLLNLNNPKKDKFKIDTVITNKITSISKDNKEDLQSIYSRLVIAEPRLVNLVKLNYKDNSITLNKHKIKFIFSNIHKFNFKKFKKKFYATIVATSKKDISNKILMKNFLKCSNYVFGVAESKTLPSIYPNLIGINLKHFQKKPKNINSSKNKIFALGSCQSNGWQAQLRALFEVLNKLNLNNIKVLGTELDIVHPDTPQGRLGTKSIKPREQDARNNLRPSFSQANISMKKIFPLAHTINTISLRTLTSPPGYQISRFYLQVDEKKSFKNLKEIFVSEMKKFSKKNPYVFQISETSLGSKAFEMTETGAVILIDKEYFKILKNPFKFSITKTNNTFYEIIMQSYVHNTRGYCRSVIETIKNISLKKKTFYWN